MAVVTNNFNPFVATDDGGFAGFLNKALNPFAALNSALTTGRQQFNSLFSNPTMGTPRVPGAPISPIGGRRPYVAPGMPVAPGAAAPSMFNDSLAPDASASRAITRSRVPAAERSTAAPSVVKDLEYWLDQVRGQDTTDYAGLQSDYEDVAAKAKNRIAAMYRSLQGERKAAEDLYGGYRDTAAESIADSSTSAADDIRAAYEDAYQTQAETAMALGIDNPLGGFDMANMADSQGANQALIAQLGQTYAGANDLGRASDLAYNQDMIGSAGFGSREAQAGIEASLAQRLAELSAARTSQGSLANLLPLAMQMQQFDSALTPGMTFEQQLEATRQAFQQGASSQQLQLDWVKALMDQGQSYEEASANANAILGLTQ